METPENFGIILALDISSLYDNGEYIGGDWSNAIYSIEV